MSDHPLDFFVRLETEVWETLVAGDPEVGRRLLSSDFLGVYPQGFEGRTEHAAHLADGPVMESYAIGDARVVELAADLVLLAYRADYRPVVDGEPGAPATMYISSIWCRRDDAWVNVFSQDTPGDPG